MAISLKSHPKAAKTRLAAAVEYILYRAVHFLFQALPLNIAYRLAELLIMALYGLFPSLKRRVFNHLDIAYGEKLSNAAKRALYRKSLRYHAWFWVDMLLGPSLIAKDAHCESIDTRQAMAAIEECRRSGSDSPGILIASSHQGSPDVIPLALGKAGISIGVVARPLDNPYIRKHIRNNRIGDKRIELAKSGALRPAYRLLKSGGIVGIQLDQDAGPNGLFVPYFGRLASTHTGPATLAVMAKCPVLMVYAIRTEARAFKYTLYAERLRPLSCSDDREAAVQEWTRKMTENIESMARRHPEQVLWSHRRWKTRPPEP